MGWWWSAVALGAFGALIHLFIDEGPVAPTVEKVPRSPVVAPIGSSLEVITYNINADHAAGALSESLRASRLLLLTDTVGVQSKKGKLLSNLDITQSQKMIKDGVILGGMIPKVQTCIKAIQNGVEAAVILDGRVPHALLLEIFTDRGFGTMISNILKK